MKPSRVALVTKYQPKMLEEFAGIEGPRKILAAFAKNPYSSAFTLCGQSGLGKTSIAFATANQIGGEIHHMPAKSCDQAAIESLMERCHYVPFFGRFHHCIIDEADAMSNNAQKALLSKLDGSAPPPDSVFYFTCNDTENLEDRFLSRTRVLKFTTDGMVAPAIALMERIWRAEKGGKRLPDFEGMLTEARFNLRSAIMTLETELLAPGSFAPLAPAVKAKPKGRKHVGNDRASLYSIGYAPFPDERLDALTVPDLIRTMDLLQVDILVDVRSEPSSRIYGFGKAHLEQALGSRYTWEGKRLGGRGKIGQSGLTCLESMIRAGKVPMMICKERAPGACHRHMKISMPLLEERGIDCGHIFADQLVMASSLQHAIDNDVDYDFTDWNSTNVVAIA